MKEKDEIKEVIVYEDNDGYDPNGRMITRISYTCPSCYKNYLPPFIDRCPECKQLLKWR